MYITLQTSSPSFGKVVLINMLVDQFLRHTKCDQIEFRRLGVNSRICQLSLFEMVLDDYWPALPCTCSIYTVDASLSEKLYLFCHMREHLSVTGQRSLVYPRQSSHPIPNHKY